MYLYHGSIIEGIKVLRANAKQHNGDADKVVYLTLDYAYSLFYIWDSDKNKRKNKYITAYIKEGIVYYEEQFPNQFNQFYDGVSGYVYYADMSKVYSNLHRGDGESTYISKNDIEVVKYDYIENVKTKILEFVDEGKVKIIYYSDHSEEKKQELFYRIMFVILNKKLLCNESENARFFKKNFPDVWNEAKKYQLCTIDNYEHECPIVNTHDKFVETWWFLTRIAEYYHNEKLFRFYLNAFVQSLRNITFMLQNEKSSIPNFDEWYSKKQENMRSNPLLRNFVESRNYVVKQRMLKTKSKVEMGLFRGYKMKLVFPHEFDDPFINTIDIFSKFEDHFIDWFIGKEHGAIGEQFGVRRQWIVEDLGDEEVLSLCLKAYKEMEKIIYEAHIKINRLFISPTIEIGALEKVYVLLETDLDPTLTKKWGWE